MATVLASVGFQGSGKSVCFRALAHLIEDSVWLNPDEFNIRPTDFIKDIKNVTSKIVLADKCHHNVKTRKLTIDAVGNRKLIWVVFLHPDDDIEGIENTIAVCKSRLAKREDHPTLNKKNCMLALNTVKKYYEHITVKEPGLIVILDMTDTIENNVKFLLNILKCDYSDVHCAVEKALDSSNNIMLHRKRDKFLGL